MLRDFWKPFIGVVPMDMIRNFRYNSNAERLSRSQGFTFQGNEYSSGVVN